MADEAVISTPTPSSKRKQVASPLLDKDGQELDAKGNVIETTSPIPAQEPKKLIIEAESENKVGDGQAGSGVKGQGRATKTDNMAINAQKSIDSSGNTEGNKPTNNAARPTRGAKRDPEVGQTLPKRGRPRKRALSMEPAENIGKQDLCSLLLDIKHTNSTLGEDLAKTIDHKMDEVKTELCTDIKSMKTDITAHKNMLVNIEREQETQKIHVTDIENRIVELEDELGSCEKRSTQDILDTNKHIQTVECALAEDIQAIKQGAEIKIHD